MTHDKSPVKLDVGLKSIWEYIKFIGKNWKPNQLLKFITAHIKKSKNYQIELRTSNIGRGEGGWN